MCRCLAVQPSGFYAWQESPLSQRDREDARQTDLIRKAWNDSSKVYGYCKLHDHLLDHGETCCPNRVAAPLGCFICCAGTQHTANRSVQCPSLCHLLYLTGLDGSTNFCFYNL